MHHRVLYDIIERDGILLRYGVLATPDEHHPVLGIYYYDPLLARPVITLDRSLCGNVAEHDTALAHEIGHHETCARGGCTAINIGRIGYSIYNQDEQKAIRWACDTLIPDRELAIAVQKGCHRFDELAEYFTVTEWLIRRKWSFLKERGRSLGMRMLGAFSIGNAAGM